MLMTMAAGAIFTSKWGMFDVTFTPWAVAEFGFSIAEVSVYFSIPAMAFLFISPFGGMVVDKVDHKKRLIGCGFAAIGMSMFTMVSDFVLKMMNFALKTMDFVLKMANFGRGRGSSLCPGGAGTRCWSCT